MNIEELAFENRKTLANLNRIDLLDIIELLQEDRKQWIDQFTKTHNESVEIQKENQELKSQPENKYEKVGALTNEILYEENTKLVEENQKLKEQVKKYEDPEDLTLMFMYCTEKAKDKIKELERVIELCHLDAKETLATINYEQKIQQKEFIKYLEDEIKIERENLEELCKLYKIPKENNSAYKFAYSYINKTEEILQKYKEIIQTKIDNSV